MANKIPLVQTNGAIQELQNGDTISPAIVGLGNVNDTSDMDKPVSTATRISLDVLDGNGIVNGMVIGINTDTSKMDISSGVYHVSGNGNLNYAGAIAVSITNIATANASYIAINSAGTIIQQTTPFTMAQRRSLILLGAVIHSDRTVINAVNNLPDVAKVGLSQLDDLMDGLGNFNRNGNIFSANGANLQINKSQGQIFKRGVNFLTDTLNPHVKTLSSLTAPSNIRYRLSEGTEYADTDSVSLFYESAPGVRTAIPSTKFSIQRITIFSSNLIRIQYGQAVYDSMSLAEQGLHTEPFTTESNIAENGLLRCMLIVKGSVTDLTDTNRAMFIETDRFGQIAIGTAGGSTSLQQAYNNSVTPEIVTTTAGGAVTIKRGSTADTDIVFEVNNGADETKFSVTGNGLVTGDGTGLTNIVKTTQNVLIKDPTGFTDPTNIIVNYNSTNRTVTLTGTVAAYYQGTLVSALVSGWTSAAHTATNGIWFLYYNGSSFVWSQTPWTFDMLQIAIINYGTADKFGMRECHGLMNWQTHKEFHETIGTYLISGGDLSGYVLNSTTAANRRPIVAATTISDEDLVTTNATLTSSLYTKYYLTGAGATPTFVVETADIVPLSTDRPYYNQFVTGAWQQTLMSNNAYQAIWLVAIPTTASTNSQKYRYIWVQGQSESTTLATIQALIPANINMSQLASPEFVFIGKIIIRYTGGNWQIISVEKLTGNKYNQTNIPSGSYLSSVTTDSTLSGDGTSANPLGVNTIPGSKVTGTDPTTTLASTQDVINSNLFQYANNGKTAISNAIGSFETIGVDTFTGLADLITNDKTTMANNLTAKGVVALATETLAALAQKIADIVSAVLTGNASVGDVLSGKTFYNTDSNTKLTGTMTNKVGSATVITPSTVDQTIAQGYYGGASGDGKVLAVANAVAENIRSGVVIAGVTGNVVEAKFASGSYVTITNGTYGTAVLTGLTFTPASLYLGVVVFTNVTQTSYYLYEMYSENGENFWVRTAVSTTGVVSSPTGGSNATTVQSTTFLIITSDGFSLQLAKGIYGYQNFWRAWG